MSNAYAHPPNAQEEVECVVCDETVGVADATFNRAREEWTCNTCDTCVAMLCEEAQ